MVYWEVMAACLIDQDYNGLSYLDVFSTQPRVFFSYPCPWSGVGTGVLIHLAKCIVLVRRRRTSPDSTLFEKAVSLIGGLETTHIPTVDEIQQTGDIFTPADHLYKIALCHRLIAKLELYRSFPELGEILPANSQVYSIQTELGQQHPNSEQTGRLAIETLIIMETIPENSRTIAIQTLILLSAGSCLGYYTTDWRRFVMNRFHRLYHRLRLQTINQAATILKQVWLRMDTGFENVHWIDVMMDNRLETILG